MPSESPSPLASLEAFAGTPCLIYPASRSLQASEAAALLAELNAFLSDWASHGSPVTGAAALLENRFVIVSHKPLEIAGCSRDSLLFFMNQAGEKRGLQWVGGARVFYKDMEGNVVDVDRPTFRKLAAEGAVGPDTLVFDTTVRETDGVLHGKFALAAKDSWHARLMPENVAAP
jgi:hypothetical protein